MLALLSALWTAIMVGLPLIQAMNKTAISGLPLFGIMLIVSGIAFEFGLTLGMKEKETK